MAIQRPQAPRIHPVANPTDEQREAMTIRGGRTLNVTATMANNAELARRFGRFIGQLLFKGTVPSRERELVILRIGWNCQSVYEFGQHTLVGHDCGVTDDEVYALTRPLSSHPWSDLDAALIRLADDLCADDCVSDATWAALRPHLTDSEIAEYLVVAGAYRMVSGFLNSCGVELDDGVPGWPEKS